MMTLEYWFKVNWCFLIMSYNMIKGPGGSMSWVVVGGPGWLNEFGSCRGPGGSMS